MSTTVTCPTCRNDITIDFDMDDLDENSANDFDEKCIVCGTCVIVSVEINVDVRGPRVISGPENKEWVAVGNYYAQKKLTRIATEWRASKDPLPLFATIGEAIGEADFDGHRYVTDGFIACRKTNADVIHHSERQNDVSKFIHELHLHEFCGGELVGRIHGADYINGRIEDYAAIRCEGGDGIVYTKASYIDALLGISPEITLRVGHNGGTVSIYDGSGLMGVCATITHDDWMDEATKGLMRGES